ncbi:hypothetical protein [Legionella sp. WA2022007384]
MNKINTRHWLPFYSPGLMERAEAFSFFIAMMIWPHAFNFLVCLFTFLVTITAIIRLVQFYNQHQTTIEK